MSFDFFTARICPHEVALEKLTLDATGRRTATFIRPPSSRRVTVYVNGAKVPSTGLFSFPELSFFRSGPYRVKSGVNDMLFLSVDFQAPQFVQLISGNVSPADMARDLQKKFPDLYITVSRNRVSIRSRERGRRTAFQFHDPRWTDKTSSLPSTARVLAAYKLLGITPGRAATGKLLFPGWTVENIPTDPTQRSRRLSFNERLKNNSPTIEVSYVTNQSECRRCHGSQIEFDYQIENNVYVEARDTDLLAQEFDKFLFTKIGSHWKWNWLGSGLIDRIGGKGSTGQITVNTMITVDVSQAFATYSNIKQQQDSKFPQQKVSDAEFPYQLVNIDVQVSPDDPTVAVVVTTISSRSQEPVELKRIVGNPSPFTLQGDPYENIRLQPGQAEFRLRG